MSDSWPEKCWTNLMRPFRSQFVSLYSDRDQDLIDMLRKSETTVSHSRYYFLLHSKISGQIRFNQCRSKITHPYHESRDNLHSSNGFSPQIKEEGVDLAVYTAEYCSLFMNSADRNKRTKCSFATKGFPPLSSQKLYHRVMCLVLF